MSFIPGGITGQACDLWNNYSISRFNILHDQTSVFIKYQLPNRNIIWAQVTLIAFSENLEKKSKLHLISRVGARGPQWIKIPGVWK